MRLSLAFICIVFSLLTHLAHATPEKDFWQWFEKNEARLFDFEKDQEAVFDDLTAAMRRVHPSITFEFGPKQENKREFVISSDGIKEAFPKVIALHGAAPDLPRWTFIKFRPRREPLDIEYHGVTAKVKAIQFTLEPDGEKAGVTLFIPGHTAENHQTMTHLAFLLLDQALGEFSVEMKVGFIEVKPPASAPKTTRPLKDLPKAFDAFTTKTRS